MVRRLENSGREEQYLDERWTQMKQIKVSEDPSRARTPRPSHSPEPWRTVHRGAPAPPVAAPAPIDTDPLVPELDVPELNTSRPLTPVVPALALRIRKLPLVVVLPALLLISM